MSSEEERALHKSAENLRDRSSGSAAWNPRVERLRVHGIP
jgi:hypothetical protein